jgi:5-methylcytosine-specific restriction enzyme A
MSADSMGMSVPRPCVVCGALTVGSSKCEACRPADYRRWRIGRPSHRPSRSVGYSTAWSRLSRRARRAQPWCTDCGATTDLTADHLVWPARSLVDVAVRCRRCNSRKGPVRDTR